MQGDEFFSPCSLTSINLQPRKDAMSGSGFDGSLEEESLELEFFLSEQQTGYASRCMYIDI